MYAKCGALGKARQVFEELPSRNVVTWSALIAGYVQHNQGEEALNCYDTMQYEGHSPNAVSFTFVLKACGSIGTVAKGEVIHNKIVSLGMLEKDIVLGNTLVDMYVKCGTLAKARQVFKELPDRNAVTWSALMDGYIQHGQGEEALKCYDSLVHEGHPPDVITFTFALKACGCVGAIAKGEEIHDKIVSMDMLEKDIVLGNALVDMYAHCGELDKAQRVLEQLPSRNVVTWNLLMAGYAQHGQGDEALKCYYNMQREGQSPDAVTFACALKACASIRAVVMGEEIHDKIVSLGMFAKDIVLGNTLVDMYVKCGALSKAQRLLEELPMRDVVTWNALMTGYVQQEQGEEVMKCYDSILCEGYSPNVVSFTCVLKACGSLGAVVKGEEIHDKIANLGLLKKDIALANTLVDMYVKCGTLVKAQQVLEELPVRDAVTWNTVLAGYAHQGNSEEALKCYDSMLNEGHSPNAVTFICVLKACGNVGAIAKGEEIHGKIRNSGMLEKNIILGSALVDMYSKCGVLAKAQQTFEELPVQDLVTWKALISGYTKQGQGEEALMCFDSMVCTGFFPGEDIFICVLKSSGSLGAAAKGDEIYSKIVSWGLLEKDIVLRNSIIDMYAKCGALAKAHEVLEQLTARDVVTWSALIAGYAQHGQGEEALQCYDTMLHEGLTPNVVTFTCVLKACESIKAVAKGKEIHDKSVSLHMLEQDILLGIVLVDMYQRCGAVDKAEEVLKEFPIQDVVMWSALIIGYTQQGHGEKALKCFNNMLHEGPFPNLVTFTCALKACGSIGAVAKGEEIHSKVVSLDMLQKDLVLGNGLVDMYVKCGALSSARQVFEELPARDVVTWSALIAGYVQQGQGEEALKCFNSMLHEGHFPDSVIFICALQACGSIGSVAKGEEIYGKIVSLMLEEDSTIGIAMIRMYCKCGILAKAEKILEDLPVRSVIIWNALIGGYVQQGHGNESLKCFDAMLYEGQSPDAITCMYALKACGCVGAAVKGKEIHEKIICLDMLEKDIVLGSAVVDMYVKCGVLAQAQEVLQKLPVRNVIMWNALIAGHAQRGQGEAALECFDNMLHEGHSPNAYSFACALKACGSIGATAKGEEIHDKFVTLAMLQKDAMLGSALVDMYAKCAAHLKALKVLSELPVWDVVTWGTVIGAYVQEGQSLEAINCFERMLSNKVKPDMTILTLVFNACSQSGLLDQAEKLFSEMHVKCGIKPELEHYCCIADLFGRAGNFDKVLLVVWEMPSDEYIPMWVVLLSACYKCGELKIGKLAFERALHLDKSNAALYALMANICTVAGMQKMPKED